MTNQEARGILVGLEAAYRDLDPLAFTDDGIQLLNERIEAVRAAISALEKQDVPDTNVGNTVSRTNVIDTEGLDEQIRCEMCRNPMHTNRGCDGNCIYDVNLYKRIMQILGERIKPLPPAHSEIAKDTNVPTNDLIRRQDAIEHLKKRLYETALNNDTDYTYYEEIADNRVDVWMDEVPSAQPEQRWIPFVLRPATDEEKEENPGLDYYLDGKLPKDGQKVLITVRLPGHEEVQADEFYTDADCSYLDGQYEIGTEAVAWMPMPAPYEGGGATNER